MKWPKKVLMTSPDFFKIDYAINAHMTNSSGDLNSIDTDKAKQQWLSLKDTFTSLNLEVELIPAQPNQPDMVFTANQTLPYFKDNKTHFILSNMRHPERQNEVIHFKNWLTEKNYSCTSLESSLSFEGMGDALWNYETEEIFGGYGFRTKKEVYTEIEQHINKPIKKLQLISENFYHLDTCLAVVNKDTAFYVPSGFHEDSILTLKQSFINLIEIPEEEALKGFAANMCVVNGTDIIIQKNNPNTCEAAMSLGLKIHTIDTSEFMKSGGSVFCMKQLFW